MDGWIDRERERETCVKHGGKRFQLKDSFIRMDIQSDFRHDNDNDELFQDSYVMSHVCPFASPTKETLVRTFASGTTWG